MGVKQRKGKQKKSDESAAVSKDENYDADKNKDKGIDKNGNATKAKKTKSAAGRYEFKERKKLTLRGLLLFLTCFFTVVGSILYYYYSKYGITILLGRSFADYKLTPFQWRKFIDENDKTILLIGGPHRSGTTIVWEAIKQHPEGVGFGDRFETGVDYSEGVLFQVSALCTSWYVYVYGMCM